MKETYNRSGVQATQETGGLLVQVRESTVESVTDLLISSPLHSLCQNGQERGIIRNSSFFCAIMEF